jgi:hypothetical protein
MTVSVCALQEQYYEGEYTQRNVTERTGAW